MDKNTNAPEIVESRRKYADAFLKTMTEIWRERIRKLQAVDSGALHTSLLKMPARIFMNENATEIDFSWFFNHYGIYVDAGTGKEVPIGNPGDIGREKRRKPKKWFYPKYYGSFRNIVEFMSESLGYQSAVAIAEALDPKKLRNSVK